jgi:transposase
VAGELPPVWTEGAGLRADGRFPPALDAPAQAELKTAVQAPPRDAGIELADWNWKVVREFVEQRFGYELCRSSCLNYLHRLGFVLKRPKKRLLKADAAKRQAFIAFYLSLLAEAQARGALIFFADEAIFRADADLRGKWVLKGEPAFVDSTSPKLSEKACYYSAVCLETGEVETMEVEDTCTAETSTAFLKQLRQKHAEPLIVIWDNGPAHHGDELRTLLSTPDVRLRLVPLPGYSPDLNPDEAIWDWARDEITRNTCLGTKAKLREKLGEFFRGLGERTAEVKQRCRTLLQSQTDALRQATAQSLPQPDHVLPTLALV